MHLRWRLRLNSDLRSSWLMRFLQNVATIKNISRPSISRSLRLSLRLNSSKLQLLSQLFLVTQEVIAVANSNQPLNKQVKAQNISLHSLVYNLRKEKERISSLIMMILRINIWIIRMECLLSRPKRNSKGRIKRSSKRNLYKIKGTSLTLDSKFRIVNR